MSSIGHVLDMVRRDKENRESREKFSHRNSAKDQSVLKSNKNIKDISLNELEDIRGKVNSKNKTDETVIGKNVIIMVLKKKHIYFCGLIINCYLCRRFKKK